jgi:hypothetical protein
LWNKESHILLSTKLYIYHYLYKKNIRDTVSKLKKKPLSYFNSEVHLQGMYKKLIYLCIILDYGLK